MLKMYIDNEEVVSKNDFTIKEEMLSASSTILNNTYPKSWELDKDYISRFYYPKDYSKLILNKDTYYPHIDGETIEGSSFQITADTTLEDEYYFKGNTTQTQTSGKNLYNVGTLTTTTSSGITFTPYYENNKLQYINVNGTATANVFYNLGRITLPAGSYIANGCTGGTTMTYQIGINFGLGRINVVNGDVSFTLSEARTMNESFIRVQSGTTVNNVKIYPMIRLSSITDATYEPYTNGPTPNPDYPQPIQVATGNQEIEVAGKNYFNFNDFIQNNVAIYGIMRGTATYTDNSITITATSNDAYTTYSFTTDGGIPPIIKVEKHTNYTLSWETDNTSSTLKGIVYIFGKASNGNAVVIRNQGDVSRSATFNTGDYEYITFRFGVSYSGNSITYSNIMLEKGNRTTSYEEFKSNTIYQINLGKNLFTLQNISSGTNLGIERNVDNSKITLNGTSTGAGGIIGRTSTGVMIPQGTYKLYINNTSGIVVPNSKAAAFYLRKPDGTQLAGISVDRFTTENNSYSTTLTFAEDTLLYVELYCNGAGYQFDNITFEIQLEKGNVATSFSPYFTPIELCKINDYKDSIKKSEGKNLFDKDNAPVVLNYYVDSSGKLAYGAYNKLTWLKLEPNTTYTLSQPRISTTTNRVAIFKQQPTQTVGLEGILKGTYQNGAPIECTFTTDDEYVYLAWVYCNTNNMGSNTEASMLSSIQVEKGEATPYEPYLAKGKWYIEKKIGKVVYNGSEAEWAIAGTVPYYRYRYITNFVYEGYIPQPLLCNQFKNAQIGSTSTDLGFFVTSTGELRFREQTMKTISEWKNWLANNNLLLYYVLATPTYTEITNEELISQLNSIELLDGLNNISITSANLPMIMNLHYNYQTEHTDSELIFSGMVKNTNNISLNPREPKYCSLEILDYKTLLSEGKTLDYVISNKTILEAISMVVDSISEYGFELGNVNILNGDEIIGAYSTENKTAYDVLQYLADISSAKWNCRRKDNTNMYIDFYDPTLMPRGKQIEYTNEWACENNLCDIKFNYGTRDYRNKQIILSDEVEGSIEYNDRVVSDGINKEYTLPYKIASLNKIEIDGVEQSIATKEEKEVGIYADFYYSRNTDTFTSNKTLPYGTLIDVSYTPIIKGREVVQNDSEIDRLTNQLEVNGTISRYENRNDTTDSNKLINIGETYLKYKGEAEITLTIRTENNNLYNVGQIVYFNAPIPELQKDYLVKSKQIQVISSDENELNIFYTFTLSSSFNAEKEINWFDNQRAKMEGNIGEGEFISRNIDINSRANIIWDNLRVEEVDLPVGASNDLQATLESPLIH